MVTIENKLITYILFFVMWSYTIKYTIYFILCTFTTILFTFLPLSIELDQEFRVYISIIIMFNIQIDD